MARHVPVLCLAAIGQANADLIQAGLMKNPVINFMMMFPDGGGRSMLRGTGLPVQPLEDLWLIPARKEVAKAALQQVGGKLGTLMARTQPATQP
jgi:outer membrane protein, heavy metal efflux system